MLRGISDQISVDKIHNYKKYKDGLSFPNLSWCWYNSNSKSKKIFRINFLSHSKLGSYPRSFVESIRCVTWSQTFLDRMSKTNANHLCKLFYELQGMQKLLNGFGILVISQKVSQLRQLCQQSSGTKNDLKVSHTTDEI